MSKLGEAEQLFASFRTSAEKGDIQQAKVGPAASRVVLVLRSIHSGSTGRLLWLVDVSMEGNPTILRCTSSPCSVEVLMLLQRGVI